LLNPLFSNGAAAKLPIKQLPLQKDGTNVVPEMMGLVMVVMMMVVVTVVTK
jgi:hypothetical protein